MPQREIPLNDKLFVELVRSLYRNVTPALIMAGAFALCFVLIYAREGDRALLMLGVAGLIAVLLRLAMTVRYRRRALEDVLGRADALRLERAFAVPYGLFSILLGMFGGYVFTLPAPEGHMITICLLVGYCAGVATGAGLRPFIAVPNMMVAIIPAALVAIMRADPIYFGMALITLAFLAAGVRSVITRFGTVTSSIRSRLTFSSLARSDGLTALPNRLALREYFDEIATLVSPQSMIAVHYVDLNEFKPVNDRYGHNVGDMLLAMVGERLSGAVRNGDIVARLGGDEFAVIQFGLSHNAEAELLAERITSAIAQDFFIGPDTILISASVGTITSSDGKASLDQLLNEADAKLYKVKKSRGT